MGKCWKYYIYAYNRYCYKNITSVTTIINNVSVPFKLTYTKNYGHALWDDLYSIYTSIVKSGYENYKFNLVFNKKYKSFATLNDILYLLQNFSMGENIYLNNYRGERLLFKKLIVGSSHQCQRCVTLDYALKYSREYSILKKIRNRMYYVYKIKYKRLYPLQGIIVHNKRYSENEIEILKKVALSFHNDKDIRIYYIDFRNYPTFYSQLLLISRVHIYISGPGTGLLNFPFMPDPGIVIHLGHIHFGCPQYLEQYMLEGSPHYKAIYYSPKMRMMKLNYTYTKSLVLEAKEYLYNKNTIYMKKNENLNEIGKLFVEICKKYKNVCEKLINNYDWDYGNCRGIWAENVIYFPSLYPKVPELKDIVISYMNLYNIGCKIGINKSKQKQCKK